MSKEQIESLPQSLQVKLPDKEPLPPPNGYTIPVSFPYISTHSKARVLRALEEATISSATSVVKELEDELCSFFKVPFAKACSNGYSALVLALKLANIHTGDHVLVPSFTMAAVCNAVVTIGAIPVFVDCQDGGCFNPSVEEYRKSLTNKCTGLIVTHTYGVPADCDSLVEFCRDNNLVFIEDIAEAIGTIYKGKYVGTFGDFATASLYANKTITCGDGGFVLSTRNDKDLRERAISYTNHGFTPEYHFLHFEHCGNYKISGLQAAMAIPAVSEIPQVMKDRERISETYRKYLKDVPGLVLMPENPYGREAPWMFGVRTESKEIRTQVRRKMAQNGIETRDFFFPLHLQPMCLRGTTNGRPLFFPNAETLGLTGLYLPTFYGLSEEKIKYICSILISGLPPSTK